MSHISSTWPLLAASRNPTSGPYRSKRDPKTSPWSDFLLSGAKSDFWQTSYGFLYFYSPAGSQRAVCWHKKTFLRPLFVQNTVLNHFGRALGSHCANLGPTWRPSRPPTCHQRPPTERFLEPFFASRYPLGAKMPSRGSREPLRPPKTFIFHPFSIDFAA